MRSAYEIVKPQLLADLLEIVRLGNKGVITEGLDGPVGTVGSRAPGRTVSAWSAVCHKGNALGDDVVDDAAIQP